jgi:hypothetical protein
VYGRRKLRWSLLNASIRSGGTELPQDMDIEEYLAGLEEAT